MFEHWFVLSIIPPLLYSVINRIDKHLLDEYFEEGGVGTLLLFSTLFSFFFIPYAVYMDSSVWQFWLMEPKNLGVMLLVGALNVLLLYCYLLALEKDDPTVVILYYQLVPVIATGLGYLVLGETVSSAEWIAMAVILFGTTLATFELNEAKKLRFRWRTFGLMMVAATCWAAETTLGKIVVIEESVYHSIFWESIAMILLGVILWVSVRSYRQQFRKAWRNNSKGILSLMVASEALYGLGNAVITHAVALKVVAVVLLLQPLQTIFVFGWGILLMLFVPSLGYKRPTRAEWLHKALAIAITCFGTYLLLQADSTAILDTAM